MKKIALDEEFSFNGSIYCFVKKEDKHVLKFIKAGSKKTNAFVPPTLDEVKDFFKQKGYSEESAIKFHEYYSVGDWKDAKGNPVKNWKQKSMAVWFVEKNKIVEKPAIPVNKYLFD
jgi:hypothetical protein